MTIKELVGSGDRIAMFVLPVALAGIVLNVVYPAAFRVGGPPDALRIASIVILVAGVAIWLWAVILILVNVPRHRLITSGPYALVRHPIYTAVALLVLPWAAFLLNTWVGIPIGLMLYLGSRRFAPAEEAALSDAFGGAWSEYRSRVRLPWL